MNKEDRDYTRLKKGEILLRDGKRIVMCQDCGKIVSPDRWCGTLHFCS